MKISLRACLVYFIAAAMPLALIAGPADGSGPPVAPVRPVTDTYHGQEVVDPYRWLEDIQGPEAKAWIKGQAEYADAFLQRLPLREQLEKRIHDLSQSGTFIGGVQRRGDRYFYGRIQPGDSDSKIVTRDGVGGTERVLVDPGTLSSEGRRYSINGYSASPDGSRLLYLVSVGGSEDSETRVMDVATGRDMGIRIERTTGIDGYNGKWLPDGQAFLYLQLQEMKAGMEATEHYRKSRAYLHRFGDAAGGDRALFGYGVNKGIDIAPEMVSVLDAPASSGQLVAMVNSTVSRNSEYYVAPLSSIDEPSIPWRKVASLEDGVMDVAVHGDDLYLLTDNNASRGKIIRTSLSTPDLSSARTVFSGERLVIESMAAAEDALYVDAMEDGVSRIWRIGYADGAVEELPIAESSSGKLALNSISQAAPGVVYALDSYTASRAYHSYDPASRQSLDLRLAPATPVDMSGIQVEMVKVRSHDGVQVPMAILSRRDLVRDGDNPALLDAYGSYGITSLAPGFDPTLLAWLERGGVYAIAGVRGGGEYGKDWHLAGKEGNKPNTWKDLIACGEHLVNAGYTSPRRLAGEGTSAGAIAIGNAIAERPDLFGAAVFNVGVADAIRFETTANGATNIPEFGSVATPEGFRALSAMDAYRRIEDGVEYPAVLLTHGINDPRVDVWASAKMAARLQAASASGKPVLLRIDYDAGHGIGSSVSQRVAQQADTYAFLWAELAPAD